MNRKNFNSMFWGIAIILAGVLLIIDYYADLNISIIRLLISAAFIYFGIVILFRKQLFNSKGNIFFSDASYKIEKPEKEYSVVFSSGKIDLTGVSDDAKSIKLNVAFGEGVILLNPDKPVKIRLTSAFGEGVLPDGSTVNFGTTHYKSKNEQNKEYLVIDASVAFGEMTISFKK